VVELQATVLVSLGGCHLLDILACELFKSTHGDFAWLRRLLCKEYRAHPTGDTKSNTSRALCEERQVVRLDQVLELTSKHSLWGECDLRVTTSEWISSNLGLASTGID
jgi:hypothetical protein